MAKRILFIGPTGSGKSTLINALFNNDIKKESLSKPAVANDTSSGVTSTFTTYYDFPSYAYTDSIGFGDNRFDHNQIFRSLKCVIKQSMVGYNRIYLCLRYGRMSNYIRYYIEFLTAVFDQGILDYCTLVFTHCKDKSMTTQLYLEKNKDDQDMCGIINKVHNVVFGDNNVDDDEEVDKILLVRRENFLGQIKADINESNEQYYIPRPTDFIEWITRINYIFKKLILNSTSLFRLGAATVHAITHGEIKSLAKFFETENCVKYEEYYGECPICLDSMWSKDATITKCHHVFHQQCLLQLLTPICPICRENINLSEEKK
ncbi:unnamed protein product [Rotaria sordida]|uniref:RING-type domain-containing protein n=1 Tax=Rotaria sordida TaxID=392033 RepID=A0A815WX86_9BILA|nr:unnamed protein product [Rotaria sordida]CAF1547383.1 unnamed protein product [Rotaria sordida]